MTEQIHLITKELEQYESELYKASLDYKDLAYKAAIERAGYDVAYAQEMLKASAVEGKRTVAEKEAEVIVIVANQMRNARIAEAMADGAKRHLTALQSNLTSIQSRASLLKTERSLTNMYS